MTPAEGFDESAGTHEETRDSVTDGSSVLAAVRNAGGRVGTTVRNSSLYRWLTKEPEPEVIVIDLRETWTVGPIIAVLDRFIEWIAPYWRESTPKRALDELVLLGERAAETRAGQLLGKLLAPPAPPESEQSAERGETPNPSADDTPSEQADNDTQNSR
jgi:hypothetical protein